MFTAKMPIAFQATASLNGQNQVEFYSSTLLLRYRNIEREVGTVPRFLTATCQQDGPGEPQNGPWRIRELPTAGSDRVFALTFDGARLSQLLGQQSALAYELLASFLDQDVIELPLNLGPILEDCEDAQPRADRQLTVPLFLQLSMQFKVVE